MDMSNPPFDGRAKSTFTVRFDFPRMESISVCEHGRKKLMANVSVLRSARSREPLPRVLDLNADARIHSRILSHFIESGCHKSKALPSVIDSALMYCNTVWVPHPCDAFVFVARVGEHDANPLGRINNQAQTYSLGHCAHFNLRMDGGARFE
jgi:hypothetical protein